MAVLTLSRFIERFEALAPAHTCVPRDEQGVVAGPDDPERSIDGIACIWKLEPGNIRQAHADGCNLLVCHEQINLPNQRDTWQGYWYPCPVDTDQRCRQARDAAIDETGVTVFRSHSSWDALDEHGVPDSAVRALGFDRLVVFARFPFFKVHELPEAVPVAELARRAAVGLPCPPTRIFGDPDRLVSRFAFLIGGFGAGLFHAPQVAADAGAECVLIGEMGELPVADSLSLGLSVIETLHSCSEMPAIRQQASILQSRIPEVLVRFYDSGICSAYHPLALPSCQIAR